jgi:hypothetical protein
MIAKILIFISLIYSFECNSQNIQNQTNDYTDPQFSGNIQNTNQLLLLANLGTFQAQYFYFTDISTSKLYIISQSNSVSLKYCFDFTQTYNVLDVIPVSDDKFILYTGTSLIYMEIEKSSLTIKDKLRINSSKSFVINSVYDYRDNILVLGEYDFIINNVVYNLSDSKIKVALDLNIAQKLEDSYPETNEKRAKIESKIIHNLLNINRCKIIHTSCSKYRELVIAHDWYNRDKLYIYQNLYKIPYFGDLSLKTIESSKIDTIFSSRLFNGSEVELVANNKSEGSVYFKTMTESSSGSWAYFLKPSTKLNDKYVHYSLDSILLNTPSGDLCFSGNHYFIIKNRIYTSDPHNNAEYSIYSIADDKVIRKIQGSFSSELLAYEEVDWCPSEKKETNSSIMNLRMILVNKYSNNPLKFFYFDNKCNRNSKDSLNLDKTKFAYSANRLTLNDFNYNWDCNKKIINFISLSLANESNSCINNGAFEIKIKDDFGNTIINKFITIKLEICPHEIINYILPDFNNLFIPQENWCGYDKLNIEVNKRILKVN